MLLLSCFDFFFLVILRFDLCLSSSTFSASLGLFFFALREIFRDNMDPGKSKALELSKVGLKKKKKLNNKFIWVGFEKISHAL